MSVLRLDLTWSTLQTLQQRDVVVYFRSVSTYVVTGLVLVTSALMIRSNLAYASNNDGLIVVANPMTLPCLVAVLILTGFVALSACTAVAREFDQGTLEVLFYGPVDAATYVIAKYLATTTIYVLILLVIALASVADSAMTNLRLSSDLLAGALLSVFTGSAAVAFAVWLATAIRHVRTATLTLVGTMIVLVGLQAGDSFLSVVAAASGTDSPMFYLAQVVSLLNNIVTWLSPFGHLTRGLSAVGNGQNWVYLLTIVLSAAFALGFLTLATLTIQWKGVRR